MIPKRITWLNYERCAVLSYLYYTNTCVVRISFESGIRFKILEADAFGVSVALTTLVVEGLNLENEVNILIADTAENFAQSIIQIIKDSSLAEKLSLNCKKKVYEKLSIENLKLQEIDIINFLGD